MNPIVMRPREILERSHVDEKPQAPSKAVAEKVLQEVEAPILSLKGKQIRAQKADGEDPSALLELLEQLMNEEDSQESQLPRPMAFVDSLVARHQAKNERGFSPEVEALKGSSDHLDQRLYSFACQGYSHVVTAVLKEKGYPMGAIMAIDSPAVMEQTLALYESVRQANQYLRTSPLDNDFPQILDYVHKSLLQRPGEQTEQELLQFLGELTFLTEQNMGKWVEPGKNPLSIHVHDPMLVHQLFIEAVGANRKEIEKEAQAYDSRPDRPQSRTWVQADEMFYNARMPVAVSKMLITRAGYFNLGVAEVVAREMVKNLDPLPAFAQRLIKTMGAMANDATLRQTLGEVKCPEGDNNPSNEVVRACLRIPQDWPVTDKEARITALSALCSHLRQGYVGSCFATCIGIQLLESHLQLCLEDFRDLLKGASLGKSISIGAGPLLGMDMREFGYVLRMSPESMDAEVRVDYRCGLVDSDRMVWDIPGLREACKAIGVSDITTAIKHAAKVIFDRNTATDTEEYTHLSVSQILRVIAEDWVETDDAEQVWAKACFHFESQINNPLLRAWEYTLGGMTEGHGQFVTALTAMGISQGLLAPLLSLESFDVPEEWIEAFMNSFVVNFWKRIQFKYDPAVPMAGISDDGSSSSGAFVMYEVTDPLKTYDWERVDSPEDFVRVTQEVLMAMLPQWMQLQDDPDGIQAIIAIFHQVGQFVKDGEFLRQVVNAFNFGALSPEELADLSKVERTPWVCSSGHIPWLLLNVYFEQKDEVEQPIQFSGDAKEILIRLIEGAKELPDEIKGDFIENSNKKVLAYAPAHAFNYLVGHPSFKAAWRSDLDTETWIAENVEKPGVAISESRMSVDVRKEFLWKLGDLLETRLNISDSAQRGVVRRELYHLIMNMPSTASLVEIREAAVDYLFSQRDISGPLKAEPEAAETAAQVARAKFCRHVDKTLFQVLPKDKQEVLVGTAVHIADTNWSHGVREIHFACLVNPGTGKMSLWQLDDTGTYMYPSDEAHWFSGPWSVHPYMS